MSGPDERSIDHAREGALSPTGSFSNSMFVPGGRIGSFQIEHEIGRGAMGVVYLAHDTKLDRPVAIKSMPVEVTTNPLIRKRWQREAQILASLNHPNIAAIYEGLEETGSIVYLILEYVPGQTLAERIAKGPLKLKEALTISLQIAEAVAAAHERDVIHRDLKPGNIRITPDGKVKVLDFGLAKAIDEQAPDKQSTVTTPGLVIGTPAYMSPEQARGQPADKRSDIWSFGCVLYEMLTGKALFEGQTSSDTLANILQMEPDWRGLPEGIPANICVLLRRCLEKDTRRRLQDIGDAALEIRETLNPPAAAPPVTAPAGSLSASAAKRRSRRIALGAAVMIVLCALAAWFILGQRSGPASQEIRMVVLPFENLGSAEDEYFAAGITDAITARLATIRGLSVISRQSAMRYRKTEKTARQIAGELRVDYILEGTVQRERPSDVTSRVRIIPQLINASDDAHVWAQAYDNDMREVFQVQSDLAEQVAHALNITLVERERRVLASRPTENMEAYDYYLRGNEHWHRRLYGNELKAAIQMYDKAVELDPKFALAYAQLSQAHATMYWFYYDHTPKRLETAKDAVDRALRLDANLPEAHLALGYYYYYGYLDYDRALEQSDIVRQSQPDTSDLLRFVGYIQRRQGKFQEAVANIKRASDLDPLSSNVIFELGITFMWMRDYPEALRCYDRAILLAPDVAGPYNSKAEMYLLWEGNTEKARTVLDQAAKNIRTFGDDTDIVLTGIWLNVLDGKYKEALAQISSYKAETFSSQDVYLPKAEVSALIYGLMANKELERAQYESAVSVLEAKIQEDPNDARFHSALGIAYAGLGRKQDAIREGRRAVELLPVSKDAMRSFYRAKDLAIIYAMVGEFEGAIDQIESLLSMPGELSIPLLKLEPAWAPLRDQPRFKKLVEAKESVQD